MAQYFLLLIFINIGGGKMRKKYLNFAQIFKVATAY